MLSVGAGRVLWTFLLSSVISLLSSISLSLRYGPIQTEILSQRAVKRKTTNQPTSSTTPESLICFVIELMFILKVIKVMINRILYSWSFHMKYMKLAENSFNKFHMK